MNQSKTNFTSVDDYILSFPEPAQQKLKELREAINELLPEAQEKISYEMPAYYINGSRLYFAGFSKHIGFYPGVSSINAFKDELSPYKHAKGSVQFPLKEALSMELIKRMMNYRAQESRGQSKK